MSVRTRVTCIVLCVVALSAGVGGALQLTDRALEQQAQESEKLVIALCWPVMTHRSPGDPSGQGGLPL